MTKTEKQIEVYSAHDLAGRDFAATPWLVDSILPEGLALLVAAPKVGKSWMALHVALCVAIGGVVFGRYRTRPAQVLYLDLETPPARRQERLNSVLSGGPGDPIPPPHRLLFADWWPAMGPNAPAVLDMWLTDNPGTGLVIVDTVAKVWPPEMGRGNAFYHEYQVLAAIKDVADRHRAAVLLIHHQNKVTEHADPLNSISGTAAFQGAADSIWVASRKRGENTATLYVTGREVRDRKLEMSWSPTIATWAVTLDPLDGSRGEI